MTGSSFLPCTRTILAGIPTTVTSLGTSATTTAAAPTLAFSPISTGPITWAWADMSAPFRTVGWRLPQSFPVPQSHP